MMTQINFHPLYCRASSWRAAQRVVSFEFKHPHNMKKVPSPRRRRRRSISYLAPPLVRVRDDIAGANKFLSQSGKGNAKNAR
jgi:hypothetical protein